MKHIVKTINLNTPKEDFIDITKTINQVIKDSNVQSGQCTIFCPHTTAGITVNENADPDVVTDMLFALNKIYPNYPQFKHFEMNSPAHLKSTTVGCQQSFIIENHKLLLGTWQGIYFCEFDGPRSRKYIISIIGKE